MTIFSFHFMIKLWKRLCTKYYFCIYGSESTVMTLFDVRDTHEWNRAANKFLLDKFLFLFENAKATSCTQSSLHKHTKKSNDIHVIALMRFSVDLSPRLSVLQISTLASITIPYWSQFGTSYPKQNRRTTYRIEDWLNCTRLIQSFKSLKATINPLGVTGKQTKKDMRHDMSVRAADSIYISFARDVAGEIITKVKYLLLTLLREVSL